MATFREAFYSLLPVWLTNGEGELLNHSLTRMIDAQLGRLRLGLEARFPTRAGESALALIGADRGIQRGRTEVATHYAQRLLRWRYPRGHRVRGNSFALLEQISEFFGGIAGYVIDAKGNKRSWSLAGVTSYSYGNAWNWDGTGPAPSWARFWVVLDATDAGPDVAFEAQLAWGDPALYGGTVGTPGYVIGMRGVTSDDVTAIRKLMRPPHPWKMAGSRAEWVIISLDGTDPAPDGTWLHWGKDDGAGHYVPARSPAFRYWSLTPEHNQRFAGDPAYFPLSFYSPGPSALAGDPALFPLTIPLPDGSTVAGDPATFPAVIPLVDDGNFPQ